MKSCPKCKMSGIPDEAKFCPKCGLPIDSKLCNDAYANVIQKAIKMKQEKKALEDFQNERLRLFKILEYDKEFVLERKAYQDALTRDKRRDSIVKGFAFGPFSLTLLSSVAGIISNEEFFLDVMFISIPLIIIFGIIGVILAYKEDEHLKLKIPAQMEMFISHFIKIYETLGYRYEEEIWKQEITLPDIISQRLYRKIDELGISIKETEKNIEGM